MFSNTPILKGGMTYSFGTFTVPKDGTYYIYGMLTADQDSSSADCVFGIQISGTVRLRMNGVAASGTKTGLFASLAFVLTKGDSVAMFASSCIYNFAPELSFFGLFSLY